MNVVFKVTRGHEIGIGHIQTRELLHDRHQSD